MRNSKATGTLGVRPALKLLLVGEHPLILEALKLYFDRQREFEVFPCVMDPGTGIPKLQFPSPNVILLDAAREFFGLCAARQLLETFPKARLIGLCALEDRISVLNLIQAGAHGCLIKACSPGELFRAVEIVIRGEPFFSPEISKIIENEFLRQVNNRQRASSNGLSFNERRLLGLISDGLSNKEMAAELNISVRTVEKYRLSLMAKLGIRTVAGLTKFAIRNGITNL